MDSAHSPTSAAESPPAAPPAKGSPARLAVLLGILAVVLGMLGYDQLMAKPNCTAAEKDFEEFVQQTNAMPVTKDGGGIVGRPDVQKHFGWGPTWVKDNPEENYTIEYYCYWGKMPYLTRQRNFITVLYKGKQRRYSTHYLSSEPTPEDLQSIVSPQPSSEPAAEAPAGQAESSPDEPKAKKGKKGGRKSEATKEEDPSPAKDAPAEGSKEEGSKPAEKPSEPAAEKGA